MLRDVIRDAQAVPTRIVATGKEATRWVRARLYAVRETSETNLFNLHVSALEGANDLVDRTSSVPVLDKVGSGAKKLLGQLASTTTAPPIPDYDELNVRKVMSALRDLDHFGLLRVARYEAANKNRKTILDAIDRETERRARLAAA